VSSSFRNSDGNSLPAAFAVFPLPVVLDFFMHEGTGGGLGRFSFP
jgi:hypothetical protein